MTNHILCEEFIRKKADSKATSEPVHLLSFEFLTPSLFCVLSTLPDLYNLQMASHPTEFD